MSRRSLALAACLLAVAVPSSGSAAGRHHVCPRSDLHPGRAHGLAANRKLVPGGATGALLCRYHGLNPDPRRVGRLAASRAVDRRGAARLARELDALPRFPKDGFVACAEDDGSTLVAFFHYAGAPDDPVVLDLRGCNAVSNGRVVRMALADAGQRLVARLIRLTL